MSLRERLKDYFDYFLKLRQRASAQKAPPPAGKLLEQTAQEDPHYKEYLFSLPPLPQVGIELLSEETGSTIQIYYPEEGYPEERQNKPNKVILIVPGYDSSGQSPKYDFLIRDFLGCGAVVVRINNRPKGMPDTHEVPTQDEIARHREAYREYMKRHFSLVSARLKDIIDDNTSFHIIASSAGAAAVSALVADETVFPFKPASIVLLGPSSDIDPQEMESGLAEYTRRGGRISVIYGERDYFWENVSPVFESLQRENPDVGISINVIPRAYHDLREGPELQFKLHSECRRALGFD